MLFALFLWGTIEALIGLCQVLGLSASHNLSFLMTGSFENPGPFGGFLAIMMSISGAYLFLRRHAQPDRYERAIRIAATVCFCSCMLVLPASMSRTAWAALLISLLIALLRDDSVRIWTRTHKSLALVVLVSAMAISAAAFFLKRDSAIGRLHIWHMEAIAIVEHPLGTGPGSAAATYGKVQEEYFRSNLERVPESVIRSAGCPEYSFNEYMHVGVEYGIPGLLFFVAVLLLAIRALVKADNVCGYGLIAWAVFAFASYPFSVPKLNLLFGVLLLVAAFSAAIPNVWKGVLSVAAILITACLYVNSSREAEFRGIYEIGYGQFLSGDFEDSLKTLSEGAEMSCDPMFHVIMGRNHEALGDFDSAEKEYWTARYMVPCRIYPLVRLTRLYVGKGDDDSAVKCAREAVAMPVNERHLTMLNLQEEMAVALDSLLSVKSVE